MTDQAGVPPTGTPDASSASSIDRPPVQPPALPAPPPAATAWTAAPPPAPEPHAPVPAAGTGWGAPPASVPAASAPAPGASSGWGAAPPQGGPPAWGSPVAVVARPKLMARTGMKTTLAVAAIMVGVVMGVNIVNAAVPVPSEYVDQGTNPAIPVEPVQPTPDPGQPTLDPGQPEPTPDPGQAGEPTPAPPGPTAAPIEPGPVSGGTTVTINNRYTLVFPDGWALIEEGEDALVFQKGSVTFVVGGTAFDGTVTELASAYRDVFFQNGNLTGENPAVGVSSTGIPIAGLNYTGTLQDAQVDGFILVALEEGSGMISNAFGPTGSLQGVGDDLSMIVNSIKRAGE